ncbi:MAG: hypothetical protein HWN68_14580 [Desulfobacterales bacterium]|nr:hypothetical protein [Desulfobacterales bacterium]
MSLCTVRCSICGGYMSRTTTKRGKPFLYCGRCGLGSMVLRQSTIDALNKVCQSISESDLPGETLKKQRGQR